MANRTHNPTIRVVSISSLFQFYIFLSCIGEKDKKFNYAVILNNIRLGDQTVSYIITLCKEKKFLFIDLRFFLKNYSKNLVSRKSIHTYNKIINEFFKNYHVEDVFLRYKINLPESLLVNHFNKAKLNFFEDGLGDYIIKKNFLGFKKKAENSINLKQKLIDIIGKIYPNNIFTKYHYKKKIYRRSNILYEFINYNCGDQKKNIINHSKKTVNIADNFQKIINRESKKHFKLITKKSIVFLSHPFQHSTFEGTNNILHEIGLYKKFLNIIKKDYADFQFFFKPHPNITPDIFALLYEELKGFFIFLPKDILSEILISNKNVYGVGSFMSSSLFYSKILYKEKFVFYLDVTNQGVIEFDANLKTVIPIYEIFNIKKIKLNSKTN